MSKYIRSEKFLEFKGDLYSYPELHDLYYKGYTHYTAGEIINTITKEIIDISNIKSLYHYALKDLDILIQDKLPEIPTEQRKYVTGYINDKQFKGWIEDIKARFENGTVTDEQVKQYWEIKSYGKDITEINPTWYPKNYIKINQEFLPEIVGLTTNEKGKIFNMMYHITFNNKDDKENIILDRKLLSEILGTTDLANIREFMRKLEKSEVLVRVDKNKKKTVTLMFNPMFILKGAEKELSYSMLKNFPNTCKKLIDIDVLKLIEVKEKLNIVSVNTTSECVGDGDSTVIDTL